jgi:hypothetical protein
MKYILFLIMLLSLSAHAETITYECAFSTFSDDEGVYKAKKPLVLTYLIDGESKKSYLIGNAGSSEVTPVTSDNQISFIEITETGNVMTTTVASDLNAVHSRNSVMSNQLIPSQYYGKCSEK